MASNGGSKTAKESPGKAIHNICYTALPMYAFLLSVPRLGERALGRYKRLY